MTEPRVIYAAVRDSVNADGHSCLDIECRFEDGQKFAAIQADENFPLLADRIALYLSGIDTDGIMPGIDVPL